MSELGASRPKVCILLAETAGKRNSIKAGRVRRNISKGELLVEIPGSVKKKQGKQSDTLPRKYRLLREPDFVLTVCGVNVAPLEGPEADYLEGITDPVTRLDEYQREGHLKWIMDLKINDTVYFKLEGDGSSKVPVYSQGKVRYYGAVEGERGVIFGIEITVSTMH